MTHKRPLCLYGDGFKLARLDQGFSMCKTYKHWIGAGSHVSYREELSSMIRNYANGILSQIGTETTPSSLMAQLLLTQVAMQ